MAKITRLQVGLKYLTLSRMKAAYGLLTSTQRKSWIDTIQNKPLQKLNRDECLPWYSFEAINFLQRKISRKMNVLELGSGSSTIWWASRVANVTTVERDKNWCEEVQFSLEKNNLRNVKLIHKSINLPKVNANVEYECLENSSELTTEYLSDIDLSVENYDVVIVDDVLRADSCIHLIESVRPNGLLILDDSERSEYSRAIKKIEKLCWSGHHFFGNTPFHFHEKQTSIWIKSV